MKDDRSGGPDGPGKPPSRRERQQETRRRGSGVSSGRIALVLAVLGLVLIVVFIIPRGQGKSVGSLPPATFTASTPINMVDPTSGKPVVPGITSQYKGYLIGHCCAQSALDWEALSVEKKETFIRAYLR